LNHLVCGANSVSGDGEADRLGGLATISVKSFTQESFGGVYGSELLATSFAVSQSSGILLMWRRSRCDRLPTVHLPALAG
jgi:hypothetical protein